jgi:hypothetical protein
MVADLCLLSAAFADAEQYYSVFNGAQTTNALPARTFAYFVGLQRPNIYIGKVSELSLILAPAQRHLISHSSSAKCFRQTFSTQYNFAETL